MRNKIEHLWQWLSRSRSQEQEAPVGPSVEELQALEASVARLEEALDAQLARQEAMEAQKEQEYRRLEEQMAACQHQAEITDHATGLYRWEAFLEKAQALLTGENPPETCMAVYLDTIQGEELPELPQTGLPENYLRSIGMLLNLLPCSLFARDPQGKLCGILYGSDPQAQCKSVHLTIEASQSQLHPAHIRIRRGVVGTACYDQECQSIQDLLERARLAAYIARQQKRPGKTSFEEENLADSILFRGQEAFQEWMEKKQVKFLLQPIVRRHNAKVVGYGLVPASKHRVLTEMDQVLALAEYLGRRQELEMLLRTQAMGRAVSLMSQGKLLHNAKLYLRSLDCLTDQDAEEFADDYFDYLKNVILELTPPRPERLLEDAVRQQRARYWRMQTALGCGGFGREEELALGYLQPGLVRGTPELIQGIARDQEKQAAFKALKAYAQSHGMELLADGIDNAQDLAMAVCLGADYLQGDYLCKAEAYPPELPEKRIAQIGEAQYGKRG